MTFSTFPVFQLIVEWIVSLHSWDAFWKFWRFFFFFWRVQHKEIHPNRSNMNEQRRTADSTLEKGCWCFYGDTRMKSVLQLQDIAWIAWYSTKECGDLSNSSNSFILNSFMGLKYFTCFRVKHLNWYSPVWLPNLLHKFSRVNGPLILALMNKSHNIWHNKEREKTEIWCKQNERHCSSL